MVAFLVSGVFPYSFLNPDTKNVTHRIVFFVSGVFPQPLDPSSPLTQTRKRDPVVLFSCLGYSDVRIPETCPFGQVFGVRRLHQPPTPFKYPLLYLPI